MPKLARKEYEYIPEYHYGDNVRYMHLREQNRPKKRLRKKINPLQVLISASVLLFTLFCAMPFAFNNITKAMFVPTPYASIKTDLYKLAFPTYDYISNAWFMGQRDFRFAAEGKKAQMLPIKENVNMPLLEAQLNDLSKLYPTVHPSVYVWDYETQNYADVNASEIYSAASIIKIPVLIDLFQSIEAGQVSLDEDMPLTEYYRTEGSGNLQFKARDSKYTIDKLAKLMITDSDNSATNMIMSRVGSMTDVNQAIRNWGLSDTELHTWLPDLKGTNHTTSKDLARMLYNIDDNEKFLTESSKQKIFEYMGQVKNNRLIQAGLGSGAKFLHKTGDIGTMLGDAGIVIAPGGKKYIVVILANRPHNAVEGKDFIVHASDIIYKYMVK
ncbi:serine hydrolase [bacterium]|nr:serine hydrolase [bacterium]